MFMNIHQRSSLDELHLIGDGPLKKYVRIREKVGNLSLINFYAAHNNTLIMSAHKHTEPTIRDKVRLI